MKPSEAVPSLIEKPPDSLTIWVISFCPPDCPGGYTLRPQFAVKLPKTAGVVDLTAYGRVVQIFEGTGNACTVESPLVWRSKNIDDLLGILPPSCVPIGKQEGDADHIVNVWIE